MFAHCMMQRKVNAINFFHTLDCLKMFVKLPFEREDTSSVFFVFSFPEIVLQSCHQAHLVNLFFTVLLLSGQNMNLAFRP